VPQFSCLSDSCSCWNVPVSCSSCKAIRVTHTHRAYFIAVRQRNSGRLLFISQLNLPILKRGEVVKGIGRKEGEENETLKVESKSLHLNSAHKRDSSIRRTVSTPWQCKLGEDIECSTVKFVLMLFSPHPTVQLPACWWPWESVLWTPELFIP
jgi:hypothetical protein